jgi:hypothetical protein
MEKIKCSNPEGCASKEFFVISEQKGPVIVDHFGNIINSKEYVYKCCLCGFHTKSNIAPHPNNKNLLNG